MKTVATLPAVEFLEITYTKISNVGLEHLLQSRSLREVDHGWAAETRGWQEQFLRDHSDQTLLK